MYPLLTPKQLNKMRLQNKESFDICKKITSHVNQCRREKKPFAFENPRHGLYAGLLVEGPIREKQNGRVMPLSEMRFFYRGQIKDYGTCYSSLYRKINKFSSDEQIRKKFVNLLRINEFNHLINNFIKVQKWSFGNVFTYAIAQHYGFDTEIIDVTDDLDVALFFSCCKHTENNRYLPLNEDDIKANKYGLLFEREAILDRQRPNLNPVVLDIGYQPFPRCNKQRGYFIHTEFGEDIQAKDYFKMYRFEHSIELSKEIYDKFDGGNKLFQYDALDEVADLVEIIKIANTFSNESFEDTYQQFQGKFTKEEWRIKLEKNENIVIGNPPYDLSTERKEAINKKWSIDKFIEDEGIVPRIEIQFLRE